MNDQLYDFFKRVIIGCFVAGAIGTFLRILIN